MLAHRGKTRSDKCRTVSRTRKPARLLLSDGRWRGSAARWPI